MRDCRTFAVDGAAADLDEARRAAALFGMGTLDHDRLIAALNVRPQLDPVVLFAGRARVDVLDWGTVAAFIQRHLGARLSYEAGCYERTLGLPAQTEKVVLSQESVYGTLSLFPLEGHRWVRSDRLYRRFTEASARLVLERPELVTPHLWSRLLDPTPFGTPPDVPKDTTWFDPPYPFGTLLPEMSRLYGPSTGRHVSAAVYEQMIRLDPYDTDARWLLAKLRYGRDPPYETMKEAYGPALDWDLRSMTKLAWLPTTPSAERRRLVTTECDLDADYCNDPAALLADVGEDDAAAEAYRRYWKGGLDRVAVAHRMGWLVEYDLTRGQEEEAWEVAMDGAATQSARALTILADLAERTKRLDVAHESYRKIAERYDRAEVLYEFYTRQIEAGEPQFEIERAALIERVFPHGFAPLDGTPTGRPTEGVILRSVESLGLQAGLRKDDVLVAVDGIGIRNLGQLMIVSDRSEEPERRLLLYRAGRYVDTRCRFEDRRIPADAATFPLPR